MRKMTAVLGLVLITSTHSYANSSCGNADIIKDPIVTTGANTLKSRMLNAELYGDVKGRVEPMAKIVKSKSQDVVKLFECLLGEGRIVLTFDVEAYKKNNDELERLQREMTPHGGKLVPTQEEIQIVDEALEATKINRLALAYINNFEILTNAPTK